MDITDFKPETDKQYPWTLDLKRGDKWVEMYYATNPMDFQKPCQEGSMAGDVMRIKHRITNHEPPEFLTIAEGVGGQLPLDMVAEYNEVMELLS
jgi:hypothetical protein